MDQLVQQVGRLLARFDWTSVVDILILGLLIYGLLAILQGTRAEILFRGVIIVLLTGFVVITIWPSQLPVLRWLVTNLLQVLLVAVLVIFAPELRRALEQIGHTGDFINRPLSHRTQDAALIMLEEVVTAAFYLSNQRWGGLIVIERTTGLQDISNKGIQLDSDVTSALLGNIFVPNTPLHDGAVIIRENRISAASCILPLSDNLAQNEHFGTRHKAAVGISEQSDAVAVVVSEETGKISVAHNGRLDIDLTMEALRIRLLLLLQPQALRTDRNKGALRIIRSRPFRTSGGGEGAGKTERSLGDRKNGKDTGILPSTTLALGDETRKAVIKNSSETDSKARSEEQVSLDRKES